MISISARSISGLFVAACRHVLDDGIKVAPRGMATLEILGAHLCLTDPRRRLLDLAPVRVLNPAFAVAEAVWIISGSDDPWIFDYNAGLARYADEGRLKGAYGPRLRGWRGEVDQLDRVRQLLAQDPDSRQAVVQLFDPGRDWSGYRDVPCTLGYRFFVRDGALQMHTTMRSQDMWLGLPYDVFTNTLIQELLAGWLGVDVGEYHHHVDSLHLYQQHHAQARDLPAQPPTCAAMPPVTARWEQLPELLAAVVDGAVPTWADPVWHDLAAVLASYRAWKGGQRVHARQVASGLDGVLGRGLRQWYERLDAHGADQTPSCAGMAGRPATGGTRS